MMKSLLPLILAGILAAQSPPGQPPRFEDYPVKEVFRGTLALPVLESPEERKFEALIGDGVSEGWGVFDGATGKEFQRPRPNFAGHYFIVSFGCGEPVLTGCFAAAIVDARTGRVYRAPSQAPGSSFRLPYFGVFLESPARYPAFSFHNFPLKLPWTYQRNSRLLIADICERMVLAGGSVVGPKAEGCGAHYYLMDGDGLKLIQRNVE
jgi:hypothetical protein